MSACQSSVIKNRVSIGWSKDDGGGDDDGGDEDDDGHFVNVWHHL